ncbi:MAG: transcription termination/antitermination protein NusG [candidate division WOR-3 bacterium]
MGEINNRNDKNKYKWFIIHVFTGQERQVCNYLREQSKNKKMEGLIDKIIVPERTIKVRDSKGEIKEKEKSLYPGYILIHAVESEAVMQLIAESPKIMGFLGRKSAQPITDEEAEKILELMGTVEEVSDTKFLEGQTVRIIDGPFTDFNGTIKELNREKERLVVMVTVFGRATPVELSYNQVEPI